jgi:hypothetical protein
MKIKVMLESQKIHQAAELAIDFFEGHLGYILDKDKFTFTADTPVQVFNKLASMQHSLEVDVLAWKPLNPWTSAIATTFKNKPGKIFINVSKIPQRSVEDYVATICHEASHLMGYNHGSNSNQGSIEKLNSVPIWLASKAKEWAHGR